MTIRVVLADDHVLMRQGVSQMLNANPDISVVGECDDGVALIAAVLKLSPDVILMDISMPRMSGLVAIDKILSQRSDAKILVLSMHNEVEYIEAMRDAGAKGYILKESSGESLVEAIKKVAANKTCFPDETTRTIARNATSVLPKPTSPHSSLSIGLLFFRSVKTSLIAIF